MNMKTLTAALTAAVLAIGLAACNRDNAGAGSSADPSKSRSATGSAAGGSSSPSSPSPSSPSSPSKTK